MGQQDNEQKKEIIDALRHIEGMQKQNNEDARRFNEQVSGLKTILDKALNKND